MQDVATCATNKSMPNLYSLLKTVPMKPAELAERLGVHKSSVARWNERRVPAERLREVSAASGIPPEAIRPELFIRQPEQR